MVLALAPDVVTGEATPAAGARRPRHETAPVLLAHTFALVAVQVFVATTAPSSPAATAVVVVSGPLWLASLLGHGVHRPRAAPARLLRALLMGALAVSSAAGLLGSGGSWLVLLAGAQATAVTVVDLAARAARRHHRLPTLVVGRPEDAEAISGVVADRPSLGLRIIGTVDPPRGGNRADAEVIASTAQRAGARHALIAGASLDPATATALTRALAEAGVHAELVCALRDIAPARVSAGSLGRWATVRVSPIRRHGWRRAAKRGLDLFGAAVGLVLLAPLLAVIAVVVRCSSRGPVLFRQERLGRDGAPFTMLKFRTMAVASEAAVIDLRDTDPDSGAATAGLYKPATDPRVTRAGRVLRALSLDELPQLWNVLRGEMSLVGPRPALASEVPMWPPELHARLRVPPGLTGLWQVDRRDWSIEHYADLDLYYVDNWSLRADLAIIGRTVPTVLSRGNR
jgi:exopolysaccharide biosynthesis polyprenyl glycosylphosphotransferase